MLQKIDNYIELLMINKNNLGHKHYLQSIKIIFTIKNIILV